MKKTFLSLLACLAFLANGVSQNKFEGVIAYSMSIDGLPPEAEQMMKDMETKVYIKGEKSRSETISAFQSTIVISDNVKKESTVYMDMMGKKLMIKSKMEDPKDSKTPDIKIKYLNDKKTIIGYNCKNAEVTMKGDDGKELTTIVWYTEEIKADFNAGYKGLKGVPMEYDLNNGGQTIKMTCKAYQKESVPDSKFDPLTGYTETTKEDFNKMLQGMGK
jgi:GLPGLI family protein